VEADASLNEASLARLRSWIETRGEVAFDLYRQRLNRALARQDREQLTQRALLGAAEEVFAQALLVIEALPFDLRFVPVERGRVGLMPAVQAPFGPFMKTLMDDVVAFNRTSCALSNFPDEHRLSREYSQVILRDLAAAWQEFSRAANGLLLAKIRMGAAQGGGPAASAA
jgi:monoamine oxidase